MPHDVRRNHGPIFTTRTVTRQLYTLPLSLYAWQNALTLAKPLVQSVHPDDLEQILTDHHRLWLRLLFNEAMPRIQLSVPFER